RIIAEATGGKFNRRDVSFTADIPLVKDTLLTSFTFASQHQDGWQRVIPYPGNSPQALTPYVVDPQSAYPKSADVTGDDYGGVGVTSMRAKVVWNASDKLAVTFTGDWSHENQTALPITVLNVYQGNLLASTFSTLYNLCISNNASTINAAVAAASFGVFAVGSDNNNLFSGICSQPRARIPGFSVGGAPLLGAGFVGTGTSNGPAVYDPAYNAGTAGAGYKGSSQPRLLFNYA